MYKLFIFLPLIAILSCNTTEPPSSQQTLSLYVEDASCSEVWIRIKTDNISLPENITLMRDNQILKYISLGSSDTLLYIDSLKSSRSYNFQANFKKNLNYVTSGIVTARTLDTTSHDFNWQSWTFGGGSSSVLSDVSIIDENDIWAVGEIYIPDSVGGEKMYNAVHWDGQSWELKKINVNFRGNLICLPLTNIFSFSNIDIWCVGSIPIHGDGDNWMAYDIRALPGLDSLSLINCWGVNSSIMYFGGANGNLGLYDGQKWQNIQSGINTDFSDIWGVNYQNNTEVYLVSGQSRKILKLNENNMIESIPWTLAGSIYSVWASNPALIFACGDGLFTRTNGTWNQVNIPLIFINKIRGNGNNDVIAAGDLGFAAHFNGHSWKIYSDIYNAAYYSVGIKENTTALVGERNDRAVITLGRRN